MNILVINCGSSSLKFSVVETESGANLAQGLFENLGSSCPQYKITDASGSHAQAQLLPDGSKHDSALETLSAFLYSSGLKSELHAIGHRVVHGGEKFTQASRINDETLRAIDQCSLLAPLHGPANLLGITTAQQRFPELPQVAVFDTAFHQSLSPEAYLYALPQELYSEHRIRRYGFHGSSHKYVSMEAARILEKPYESLGLISAHLGNGSSIAAIENGQCVDTSMGLTPMEGLVMGTRCGDIDPGVLIHLNRSLGLSIDEIDTLLNKKSGLLGLSGLSHDMRTIREASAAGNEAATLAIKIFIRRLAKSIAALRTSILNVDALIFTGGIGENDWKSRSETVAKLSHLKLKLDEDANRLSGKGLNGVITTEDSPVKAIVIQTNEELMIARETEHLLS